MNNHVSEWPKAAKKQEIVTKFSKFSLPELKSLWIEAVVLFRNLPKEKARYVKVLRKNEVAYIMAELGELED